MTAATYETFGNRVRRFSPLDESAGGVTAFTSETAADFFNQRPVGISKVLEWLVVNGSKNCELNRTPFEQLAKMIGRRVSLSGSPVVAGMSEPSEAIGATSEGHSAFQQDYEPIEQAVARFDEALSELRTTLSIPHSSRTADRIQRLALASEEEGEIGPSYKAVDMLRALMIEDSSLKYPDLTLGPQGALLAEWRGPERRLLGLYFSDLPTVKFVIFRPNARHLEIMDRYSGNTTIDELLPKLKSLDGISWAQDE